MRNFLIRTNVICVHMFVPVFWSCVRTSCSVTGPDLRGGGDWGGRPEASIKSKFFFLR
jgi:hypothetical protein